MPVRSAIPNIYFALFGIYEPILTTLGLLGALASPTRVRSPRRFALLYSFLEF